MLDYVHSSKDAIADMGAAGEGTSKRLQEILETLEDEMKDFEGYMTCNRSSLLKLHQSWDGYREEMQQLLLELMVHLSILQH